MIAGLAAAAVAGEALAGSAAAKGEDAAAMGSTVFDWNGMTEKPNDHGSTRTVCSRPTATLENLEMHVSTLKPGMSPHPPHKHPNEELIIIRQGTVETLSNGEWVRVGPVSIIFNGSNQVHGFRNVGTDVAVYHVVNVKTEKTPAA